MRRDDAEAFTLVGPPPLPASAETVIDALSPLVTAQRLARIEEVVAGRTFGITTILDNLADPHNVAAILRSCEAFGIGRVNIISEHHAPSAAKQVAKGSHRWLDLAYYRQAMPCLHDAEQQGYRLFVATMKGRYTPETLPMDRPVAIVLGNEHRGPSAQVCEHVTDSFAIPMQGFVESLNVSVAAAITLHRLRQRLVTQVPQQLSAQHLSLKARYLMHSVNDAAAILRSHINA